MSQSECPACGKSGFSSEGYMKRHHKLAHGETLKEKTECEAEGCEKQTFNEKFCSQECLGKARKEYEKGTCNHPDCQDETYKNKYCSRSCANRHSWRERDNPAKREEVRQKISEKQQGENNSFYGESHSEEALQKISESTSGEDHHLYGVTGEDHPSYGIASGLKLQKVEETGHTVRSNWEKEIDLMLHRNGTDYQYEPKTFDLPNGDTYTPDFIVEEDTVVEVKGWPDEESEKRAWLFMEKFPEYLYVVVGNEIPCDRFIDWENRSELRKVI